MTRFAVMFEIEKGEPEYVRISNPFDKDTPVLLFRERGAAEQEAKRWNTGVVVVWNYREGREQ